MKKLLLIVCLILLSCIPTFAEYKPIPQNLTKQYKKEIEQIIELEYHNTIKNVNNNVKNAKKLRDKIIKYGFNKEDYINLSLIPEVHIPAADLGLYAKLLEVTYEKYLGIKYEPIGTDSVNPLYNILSPYFKDNNVNTNKLTKIILYENKHIKLVEKYIKQVEKLRPTNN